MRMAAEAYETIMRGRPDYGKETTEYAVGLTECLSYLSEEELQWVTDPRDGLSTYAEYSKFLPQPCDVHEFIRAKRAKTLQFKPHTTYRRLNDDHGPWDKETDYERKAKVVKELLGYNPSPKAQQVDAKRELVPPTAEDLKNLRLKTPEAPPSRYLIAQLEAEGWPFIPGKGKTA
jgi:hypothetical protein